MQFKGLFAKVYSLILVPSIALLVISIFYFNKVNTDYQSSKSVKDNIKIIRSSINLLSVMQVERGMSIAYVNGANNKDKLDNHRKTVDLKHKEYIEIAKTVTNINTDKAEANIIKALELRSNIDSKIATKKDIAPAFTMAIRELMHKIDKKIEEVNDPEMIRTLINLNELNEAKENGGLLRANLSAIIARAKGISTNETIFINGLKARFASFSRSTSLKISDKISQDKYQTYLNLKEHKTIESLFLEVMNNKDATSYSMSSNDFFQTISFVLKNLNSVIFAELDHLEDQSVKIYDQSFIELFILISFVAGYFSVATVFTSIVVIRLVRKFRDNLHNLNNKTLSISLITEKLFGNTKKVFEASSSQSSDIESTSSAIKEVNAILATNNDLVKTTREQTDRNAEIVDNGKKQVQQMLKAINAISESSNALISQVENNNSDISKVNDVIKEIADKTTIINDIVFQTKLLSFNASVEAARAGEHGKGFSVVAEEIGQLASLSGKASSDIAELVTSSLAMVDNLTKDIVSKMDYFVKENENKVAQGKNQAGECQVIFDQIFDNSKTISTSMEQLEVSANEQSLALGDISKNVIKLDEATQSNSKIVDDNFTITENISDSTKELKSVVDEMCVIIRGGLITEDDRLKHLQVVGNDDKVKSSNVFDLSKMGKKDVA